MAKIPSGVSGIDFERGVSNAEMLKILSDILTTSKSQKDKLVEFASIIAKYLQSLPKESRSSVKEAMDSFSKILGISFENHREMSQAFSIEMQKREQAYLKERDKKILAEQAEAKAEGRETAAKTIDQLRRLDDLSKYIEQLVDYAKEDSETALAIRSAVESDRDYRKTSFALQKERMVGAPGQRGQKFRMDMSDAGKLFSAELADKSAIAGFISHAIGMATGRGGKRKEEVYEEVLSSRDEIDQGIKRKERENRYTAEARALGGKGLYNIPGLGSKAAEAYAGKNILRQEENINAKIAALRGPRTVSEENAVTLKSDMYDLNENVKAEKETFGRGTKRRGLISPNQRLKRGGLLGKSNKEILELEAPENRLALPPPIAGEVEKTPGLVGGLSGERSDGWKILGKAMTLKAKTTYTEGDFAGSLPAPYTAGFIYLGDILKKKGLDKVEDSAGSGGSLFGDPAVGAGLAKLLTNPYVVGALVAAIAAIAAYQAGKPKIEERGLEGQINKTYSGVPVVSPILRTMAKIGAGVPGAAELYDVIHKGEANSAGFSSVKAAAPLTAFYGLPKEQQTNEAYVDLIQRYAAQSGNKEGLAHLQIYEEGSAGRLHMINFSGESPSLHPAFLDLGKGLRGAVSFQFDPVSGKKTIKVAPPDWLRNTYSSIYASLLSDSSSELSYEEFLNSPLAQTVLEFNPKLAKVFSDKKLPPKKTYKFHTGGAVPGPQGKEVPATLRAGEVVLSPAEASAYRERVSKLSEETARSGTINLSKLEELLTQLTMLVGSIGSQAVNSIQENTKSTATKLDTLKGTGSSSPSVSLTKQNVTGF